MREQSAEQLTKDTSAATLISLSLALFSGLLLYSTDPDKFYLNVFFLFKITCLLLAILFHYTIHRKVVMANSSAALRILVAVMSLSLWVAVVFGGIFIEFVKPGLGFDYHAAPAGDLAAKHRAVPVYPRIGSRLRDPAGAARIGDPGICRYRVLTDLRLLNWALRGHSIESVVNQMRVPKRCAHGKRDRRRPA